VFGSIVLALAVAEAGRRLLAPREEVLEPAPAALESYFTTAEIERGARFQRPQLALGMARSATDAALLALLAWRPPAALQASGARPVLRGATVGAGLGALLTVAPLPLSAIARRRAVDVGLVTQSWRGWAVDLAKATAIQSTLAAGGSSAALAATRRYPRIWWLPAAGASVVISAAFATLAPVLLDPVFNKFTPLPDGETRSDVLQLAEAAGVRVGEVYTVDASRRTTAANAYVTGLGPTKRVVLYDTLLDRYTRDEVRVVVAHELAHVRNRDVIRGILYGAIVAPAIALAVAQLGRALPAESGTPAELPGLALALMIASAPAGLIGSRLSRAVERRADAYSLELSSAPDAFISFERQIALQNVADLDPPRLVRSVLASHPSTLERIGAALAWSRRQTALADETSDH
jgi:STE24 endopeptidase